MKARIRRLLGLALAAVAAAYFIRYASVALAGRDLSGLLDRRALIALIGLTSLYMLLIPTTALAWTWLLRTMRQPAHYRRMLQILATTQFGKYLPGNVAQHIGRVALATDTGIPLPATLFSVAYEMLLVLVACAHLGALTLLWSPPAALARWEIARYRAPLLALVTAIAVAALLLAPRLATWLARRRASRQGNAAPALPHLLLNFRTVVACYLLYALNFCLVGIGLWLVTRALVPNGSPAPGIIFLTGAFAGSWILGFLAPGAPAGLGIREALLSAWLSGSMPAPQIVLVIVALRIATSIGDLLNFVAGSIAMKRHRAAFKSS